jgi:predicted alpha/beta-fold hydrolase
MLILDYERENLILKDGGTLAMDWFGGLPKKDDHRPTLVCVAGIGDTTHASYINQVA